MTVDHEERSAPTPEPVPTRRARVGTLIGKLVDAIRRGDDKAVEQAVVQLSKRKRWLAPLALIVGAFIMLFQGVKLLYTNWRLAVLQIIPAMWIWVAMLDIKLHVLHGRQFHVIRGPILIPCIIGVTVLTAASFYLNGVFAFAISVPGKPEIRPSFVWANLHLRVILTWGCAVGLALSFSALIATRWGHWPFVISQSIVVGIMMLCYVAVPARLVGVEKKNRSRRDALAATAVGGAVGGVVCSPPYMLGRIGILMLGWPYVFWLGIILIIVGVTLQTGATSAVKAVKFSAKLVGPQGEVRGTGDGRVTVTTTLEWFGTATFRVRHAGLDLFFDAYLDRLPGLTPVGLSTAEVDKADFVFVSHAHFDHLYGADAIALRTGAVVVASPESAHCLRAGGVPEEQLLIVTGGETVQCGPDTTVRVLPALHSCLFAHSDPDTAVACLGDLGVSAQARAATMRTLFGALDAAPAPAGPALIAMNEVCSRHDGGQLAYLLQTARGSVLVSGSVGYWRGIFEGLRPDIALLSLGGRPNVDGEPFQGSSVDFMLEQVQRLGAGRVAFCHHDPLFPGFPGVDIAPAAAALTVPGAPSDYFSLEYATPVPILG